MMIKVEDDPKAPFQLLLHQDVGEGATPFPGLLHFTHDPYLTVLSAAASSTNFLSLWYDSTKDGTPVSWTIGKHSTH